MGKTYRKNPAAVELGRMGGKKRSDKKAEAVRNNGRKGGRPRKHEKENIK